MSDDLMPVDLDELASKVRNGICSSYSAVLIGNAPPVTQEYLARMTALEVGDLVAEVTTQYMKRPAIDAVGILEAIAWEPVDFGDPDFVWDEEEEGRPHPAEKVFYIRTFDGRRFRWTNALFVAAVTEGRLSLSKAERERTKNEQR